MSPTLARPTRKVAVARPQHRPLGLQAVVRAADMAVVAKFPGFVREPSGSVMFDDINILIRPWPGADSSAHAGISLIIGPQRCGPDTDCGPVERAKGLSSSKKSTVGQHAGGHD